MLHTLGKLAGLLDGYVATRVAGVAWRGKPTDGRASVYTYE